MKVIDLFAGVGGLSLGFKQAGFSIIFANEYNKLIAKSYSLNHPKTIINTEDIRDLNIKKVFGKYINKIDVLMGGPPCQGFSQKGKRVGINDERNYMFKHFFEVVRLVKPKVVLLENVPSILTAANGYFKKQIEQSFKDLGYQVESKVLKAEDFGVPQTRRRAVFLGNKCNLKLNLPEGNKVTTTISDAIDDLPKLKSGEGNNFMKYDKNPTTKYQKKMRINSKGLYNHISTKHSKFALKKLQYATINGSRENFPIKYRTKSIYSGTWSRLNPNGFAKTITTRFDTPSSGQFTLPYQDRCLTVREAARIQSFPDSFIFYGNKSNQMLQVGNAVPPLMAYQIALKIKKALKKKNYE